MSPCISVFLSRPGALTRFSLDHDTGAQTVKQYTVYCSNSTGFLNTKQVYAALVALARPVGSAPVRVYQPHVARGIFAVERNHVLSPGGTRQYRPTAGLDPVHSSLFFQ